MGGKQLQSFCFFFFFSQAAGRVVLEDTVSVKASWPTFMSRMKFLSFPPGPVPKPLLVPFPFSLLGQQQATVPLWPPVVKTHSILPVRMKQGCRQKWPLVWTQFQSTNMNRKDIQVQSRETSALDFDLSGSLQYKWAIHLPLIVIISILIDFFSR